MPIKLNTTTIAGATWQLNTLPADKGLEVLGWLMAAVGSPVAHKVGSLSMESDIGPAIGGILEKLGDPKVSQMIQTLLSELRKNNQPIVFASEFSGDYGTLSAVLKWALECNFSSFFLGNPLLTAIGAAGKQAGDSKQGT